MGAKGSKEQQKSITPDQRKIETKQKDEQLNEKVQSLHFSK